MNERETAQWENGGLASDDVLAEGGPVLPVSPWPLRFRASGLYEAKRIIVPPTPVPLPIPINPNPSLQSSPGRQGAASADGEIEPSPLFNLREDLRLDIDGQYPQMMASGTIYGRVAKRVDWIAKLSATGPNGWSGPIWFKDGDVATFPYTNVEITVAAIPSPGQRKATIRFSGGATAVRSRTLEYKSPYFRRVEFEFDCAEGVTAGTSIDTHAHPNRPATMPKEQLTIETVYRRAGFDVKKSTGDSIVPLAGAGSNVRWSDTEMHDAMQTYWSRFAGKAQWSMWVLFASLHEQGTTLGGIMFDDIGPNHRQGTALFNDSFIATAPAGDTNPAAWVQRMRFWTACHEMGHAFNLAHSWQKEHPSTWGTPWLPLTNEPEARSFMNYPYNVSGGQTAFFADFAFRFSDNELVFMRHAPERFVQMGNADWFDHHGFEQANRLPEPSLQLDLRVDRAQAVYQFLEPVVLELKLSNISARPLVLERELLSMSDHMTVVVKPRGKPARQYLPFARYCYEGRPRVVMPGDAMTDSLFISVGRNGWDIAEPGYYTIQIALHMESEDIISDPLTLRVSPPRGYDEEWLAQDFFSDGVGRILNFDGSRILHGENDTLREISERLSDRAVAYHARIALASPLARDYKMLDVGDRAGAMRSAKEAGAKIRVTPAQSEEARQLFSAALLEKKDRSIATLGRVDYEYYLGRFGESLTEHGAARKDVKDAKDLRKETRREKARDVEHTMKVIKEALSGLKDYAHESK